jgi:hypothetical protein
MATATKHSKACGFGRRNARRVYSSGDRSSHAVLSYSTEDGSEYCTIAARSARHAERLIARMCWEGFKAHAAGQYFAGAASYNAKAKRVQYAEHLDI